jgi:hypothetical protein
VSEAGSEPRGARRVGRLAALSLGVLLAGCGGEGTPQPATDAVAPRRAPACSKADPGRFLHAELEPQRRTGPPLDPARPKALIYANAPGAASSLSGRCTA